MISSTVSHSINCHCQLGVAKNRASDSKTTIVRRLICGHIQICFDKEYGCQTSCQFVIDARSGPSLLSLDAISSVVVVSVWWSRFSGLAVPREHLQDSICRGIGLSFPCIAPIIIVFFYWLGLGLGGCERSRSCCVWPRICRA